MSQHVPGPWTYSDLNWCNKPTNDGWYIIGDPHDDDEGDCATSVAIVPRNPTSHPYCEDTARLISAAPDLLNALKDMMDLADSPPDEIGGVERLVRNRAHAAIAKAEGTP